MSLYIPGDELLSENIIFYVETGKKGIVEVDLSAYTIEMPPEGVFAGIECLAYYDATGIVAVSKINKPIKIEFHKTKTDNYAVMISLQNPFWMNRNKWLKNDFENVFKTEPGADQLLAPTFGLKVVSYGE